MRTSFLFVPYSSFYFKLTISTIRMTSLDGDTACIYYMVSMLLVSWDGFCIVQTECHLLESM